MSQQTMPEALQINSNDTLWVDAWMGVPGLRFQLLAADVENATFTVRIQFPPGLQLPPHHHTGAVHAWTMSGEWGYLEHPDAASRPGSYLYEPPGTAHTLKIADHNTGEVGRRQQRCRGVGHFVNRDLGQPAGVLA